MKVIYEVNLSIDDAIYSDYLTWLKTHIKDMLGFNGFMRAQLVKDTEAAAGKQKVTVYYFVEDKQALQNYFDNHAVNMRDQGRKLFGEQFSASRRVLDFVEQYDD